MLRRSWASAARAKATRSRPYRISINRWDFQQNQPWNNLSKYAALVGVGQYGGQTTQTIPTQSNPWLTGLGTAGTLASIAGSLFGRGGVFR